MGYFLDVPLHPGHCLLPRSPRGSLVAFSACQSAAAERSLAIPRFLGSTGLIEGVVIHGDSWCYRDLTAVFAPLSLDGTGKIHLKWMMTGGRPPFEDALKSSFLVLISGDWAITKWLNTMTYVRQLLFFPWRWSVTSPRRVFSMFPFFKNLQMDGFKGTYAGNTHLFHGKIAA